MCKRFIPYAHAKNIYEVDIDFFKFLGAKYLFLDLDNARQIHWCLGVLL